MRAVCLGGKWEADLFFAVLAVCPMYIPAVDPEHCAIQQSPRQFETAAECLAFGDRWGDYVIADPRAAEIAMMWGGGFWVAHRCAEEVSA